MREKYGSYMIFESAEYDTDSDNDSNNIDDCDDNFPRKPLYQKEVFIDVCSKCTNAPEKVQCIASLLYHCAVNKGCDLLLVGCTLNSKINKFLQFYDFEWLRRIVINNNDIEEINFDIFPKTIHEVVLKNNKLRTVRINRPYNFLSLIDLSENRLVNLHFISYRYVPNLQKLYVAKNMFCGTLTNIFDLTSFASLSHFDISYNKLTSFEFINKTGKLYYVKCIYNELKKVCIMSDKIKNIEISHNTMLQRVKLFTIELINLLIFGNLNCLDNNNIHIVAKNNCKIEIEPRYAKIIGIGAPNVTLVGKPNDTQKNILLDNKSCLFENTQRNNNRHYTQNVSNNNQWTHEDFKKTLRTNAQNLGHINFNNKTEFYRDYDGYSDGYYNDHTSYQHREKVRKTSMLTKDNLDFFVKKTIEEYAKQIRFHKDREFRNLLDSNFIYLGDEIIV